MTLHLPGPPELTAAAAPTPAAPGPLEALRHCPAFLHSPLPCWVYDVATRAFLEVNPAAERVYGYSRHQFLGMHLADIRRPSEAARLDAYLDACSSTNAPPPPRHWVHRTRSGEDIAVTVEAVDFPCGEHGARMVFVTDITAQRASAVENKLLYQCLESAGDMIVVTSADRDAQGKHPILYVNQAFEQRTGHARSEVLGQDPSLLQGPGTDRRTLERIHQALATWQPVTVELLNYTRSGQPFWVELSLTPVADERGWYHYWFAVERDISARKATERSLRDQNAVLEQHVAERTRALQHTVHELEAFNHAVSHDLQNPLNGVRGFAEILLMRQGAVLPADAIRMLGLIKRSADQMHHIVEQLLLLSRISRMQPRPVQIAPAALCRALLDEIVAQPGAPAPPQSLDTSACAGLQADLPLLRCVLQPLLDNACKFSGAAPAVIRVSTRPVAGGVVLSVADQGLGFAAADARALFNPFCRLAGARGLPGLGTGLAQAARAAQRLDGWLWADARPGQGACFHLYLPQAAASAGPGESPAFEPDHAA